MNLSGRTVVLLCENVLLRMPFALCRFYTKLEKGAKNMIFIYLRGAYVMTRKNIWLFVSKKPEKRQRYVIKHISAFGSSKKRIHLCTVILKTIFLP